MKDEHRPLLSSQGSSPPRLSALERFFLIRGKPWHADIWSNVSAGLTVALINVPLSVSLALASGVDPLTGIITGFWSCFFGAMAGGSHFNVMGVTGALSGILFRYSALYTSAVHPYLALGSALLIFIVFALHWDQFVLFLPSAVNVGFTLGVAFIIAGGQLANACGLNGLPVRHEFIENFAEAFGALGRTSGFAFLVFFASWMVLILGKQRFPRIPWAIVVATIGILLGYASEGGLIPTVTTLKSKYGTLQFSLTQPVVFPPPANWDMKDIAYGSFSVAFVAILETLISGKIADGMTKTNMNSRRETFAVGVANAVSGLAGGIPATAALARTALNIKSGATSRVAGVLAGIFTLLIAVLLLPAFSQLPMPIVAALLVNVAVGMIETHTLVVLWRADKSKFFLALIVAVLCVVHDPVSGIMLGSVVGLLSNAREMSVGYCQITTRSGRQISLYDRPNVTHDEEETLWDRIRVELEHMFGDPDEIYHAPGHEHHHHHPRNYWEVANEDDSILTYRVVGKLTYINAMKHTERLLHLVAKRPDTLTVIISMRATYFVDVDGLIALEEATRAIESRGKTVLYSSLQPPVLPFLEKAAWFQEKQRHGEVFPSRQAALEFATTQLGQNAGTGADGPYQLSAVAIAMQQRRAQRGGTSMTVFPGINDGTSPSARLSSSLGATSRVTFARPPPASAARPPQNEVDGAGYAN